MLQFLLESQHFLIWIGVKVAHTRNIYYLRILFLMDAMVKSKVLSRINIKSVKEESFRKPYNFIILSLCIIAGIAVMFSLLNARSFWGDEVYQTLCVRNYKEAPLGVLVYYIGHLWTSLFGFNMMNLRYLAAIETTLAIGVTSFYLYRITKQPLLTGFSFLLGCVLMKLCEFTLYNWDSGTYLFDSLAICCLVSSIGKPSRCKFIALGALIAFMALGRLTSGIFLLFTVIIIVFACKDTRSSFSTLQSLLLIVFSFCITFFLITFLILEFPLEYFNLLRDGKVVSGHSFQNDGYRLVCRLASIIQRMAVFWFPGIGCLFMALIFQKIKRKYVKILFLCLFTCYCLLLSYDIEKANVWMGIPLCIGGDGIIGFGLLLAYPIFNLFERGEKNKIFILKLWAVFFLIISISFGSDAFFERMASGFLVPLLVGLIWQLKIVKLRNYLISLIGISLMVFASLFAFTYLYLNISYNKYYSSPILSQGTPFEGIITYFDEEEGAFNIKEAVGFLNDHNIPFSPLEDHQMVELLYGPHNGLSFHEYHEKLHEVNGWLVYGDSITNNVDAFVYSDCLPPKREMMLEHIKANGFTDTLRVGNAIIYFREGHNPSREKE